MDISGRLKALETKLKQQTPFRRGNARKGGKPSRKKGNDFHRVTEFRSWVEYWNLYRQIFFFSFPNFLF